MFDWNQAAAEAFGKTPAQGGDPQPSVRSDDDPVARFVAEHADRASRVAQAVGTSPENVLAQWGLETGWGQHVVPGTNNLGNVKDFTGGGVSARDNMLGTSDKYRAYDTPDAFADDFASLLKRRYNVSGMTSPADYARALKAGGYAQDPAYVDKLVQAAGMVGRAGVPLGQPAQSRDVSWQNPDLAGSKSFDLTPEKPKDAGGFFDHMGQGARRGFEQSKGLAGGMAALLGKTADEAIGPSDASAALQTWGMDLYKRKMEESGKLSNDASLTDVLAGKSSFNNWMGDALGYLGYQAAESILTGGAGALLAKTVGKGVIQATAKPLIAKEIATLTAANAAKSGAEKLTGEQIARIAVQNVATKVGAAVPVFANNLRQEGGSIYGEAVEGGHGDDIGRIWLASLAAAGVDTAAEGLFAEKLLGQGHGYTGNYLKRFGKEAAAGALTQGGTEGVQTGIERWGAQQSLSDADALRDYIDSIGVGAFGGAAGAPMAAMHEAKAKVDQAAAQPDSPLARAAQAGGGAQAAAMQAGAIGQEQGQPGETSGAMVPAGAPVIDNRITRLDAELTPIIQAMRANPAYGPTSVNEVLSAFAVAKNPNTEPAMRERILGALEQHIAQFKSNPNWTSGNAGAQPDGAAGTAVAPAANTAVGSPVAAQDGRVLDGSAREVHDASALPGQPVGALPAPSVPALQDNRAKAAADADYEAGYADLVKLEQLDRERDALARLAKHDQTAADRLHEIQLTIEGNRAIETANKRRAALSTLLDHPNAAVLTYQGLANAAQLVLRHAGFRDTRLTPDEQAALQRFSDLNDTFRAGPDVAPAAPNELSMPERTKAVQRAPSVSGGRMLGIRKALAQGARISGNKVLSKHGKALFSNLTDAEIRDVASGKSNPRQMTQAAPAVASSPAAQAAPAADQIETPHAVSEKSRVESSQIERGYDTRLRVPARALMAVFERQHGEPMAWSDAKLRAAREGRATAAAPEVAIQDAGGRIGINDGRHRIAAAAERGEDIDIAVPRADSEKIKAALAQHTEQGGTPSPAAADTSAEGQGATVGETAQETRTSTPAPIRPLDFADFARKHMGTVPKVGTPELDKLRADYKAYRDGLATASATPLDQAAHEAATSPANDKAEPTDKQKESGKYEKGPITVAGIRIDIENPAGSTRSGTDEDGKRWTQTMRDHYGELVGTRGADGDKIDAFVVPGTLEDYAGPIYVIDQKSAKGGFDEHKVVIGASDPKEAVAIYRRNYEPGWDGVLSVAGFKSPEQFKQWLASRDHGRPANEWIKAQTKPDTGATDTAAPEQVAVGADDNKRSREPNDAEAQNGGEAEARDSVDAETQQGDDLSPEVREKIRRISEAVGKSESETEERYRSAIRQRGQSEADEMLDFTFGRYVKGQETAKEPSATSTVARKEPAATYDLSTVEGLAAAIRDEIADSIHRQQIKSLGEDFAKGRMSAERRASDQQGYDRQRDEAKSRVPSDKYEEIARAIHEKDVPELISKFVHGMFDSTEKVFERATGVKIRRLSAENKRQALYQWGGWDADRIKAFEDGARARAAEAETRRAEVEKREALERAWDVLSRIDARDKDGTVVRMGDWLLRKFGDGFNRITTSKRGVATVYHLSSGDGTINLGIKHKAWTEFLKAAEKSGGLESALRQLGKLAKQDDEPSAPASDRAGEAGPEKAYFVSGNINGGRVAVELGEGFDAHPVSLPSAPGFKFIAHRSVGDNFMPTDKFSVSEETTGLSVTTGADSVEEAIRLADARIERAGLEKLSGSIDKTGPVSALPKYERTADDTSESSDDGLSGVRDLIAKTEAETKSAFDTLAPLGFELHEPVVKHPDTVAQWKRERKSDVDVVSLRRKDGDFVYVLTATDGGDPQYFSTPAEVSTALEGVEVEHHAAPESSDNDLDAMFDDVLSEVVGEKAPKKPRTPRKQAPGPRVTNADGSYYNLPAEAPKKPRSAGKAAASAAGNAAKGIGDTIAALGALFGGNGKLSSGLTFDEQTYERAKPLFKQAVAHFSAAGSDLREAMQAVVRMVVEQFGAQTAANMKPYVVRFIGDMRDGKLEDGNVDQRNGSAGSETLGDVAAGENRSPQEAGDVGGGDAQRGGRGAEADSGSDRLGPSTGGSAGGGDQGAHSARSGKGRGGRGLGGRGTGSTRAGVSGDDGGGRAGGAGLRPQESVASPAVPAINFQITKDVRLGSGGEVEKFNDNLAAIRTLRAIESENRRATPDEQRTLARYVGWGGLANAFADDEGNFKPGWEARGSELASLLLPSELKAARRSTRNAHYTSETVVRAMWDAVERLGFSGGNAIEPSVGTGNFIGLMPESRRADTRFIGVEYDSLTARIAKALYPQSTILHSGFQNVPLADNSFDLAIGNPPFGQESLRFAHKPELRGDSIHNQFFRASMDAVKPGGLHVMVVSRYLMDRLDKSARVALATEAELLGAIRLPDTAFAENARTQVVTDILFLRKRDAVSRGEASDAFRFSTTQMSAKDKREETPEMRAARERIVEKYTPQFRWLEVTKVPDPLGSEPMDVNTYFADNPHMIAGRLERSGSMKFSRDEETGEKIKDINVVLDDGKSLGAELSRIINTYLPKIVPESKSAEVIARSVERFRTMSDALSIAVSGREVGDIHFDDAGNLIEIVERETPEGEFELSSRTLSADSPWSGSLYLDADGRWFRVVPLVDEAGNKVKKPGKDGKPTRLNEMVRETFASDADVPDGMRLGASAFARLHHLAKLRDVLKRQLVLETQDASDSEIEANRAELARLYNDFVAKHEQITSPKNAGLVSEMPDGALLIALESDYRPAITPARAKRTGERVRSASASPAAILSKRVLRPYAPAERANSPSDALLIALSESGRVDLERIAALLGTDEAGAIKALHDDMESPLIFKNPETEQWDTAQTYLSGNVRKALEAAKAAGLEKNIAALEKVQPEPWGAEAVTPKIGANWVPADVYAEFAEKITGGKARVSFAPITNSFAIHSSGRSNEYGTDRMSATALLDHLLNSKSISIFDEYEDKRVFNKEETALANLKARAISLEFDDWVFADGERRDRLVKVFNDKFNNRVPRQHDGSHLKLIGKVPDEVLKLRPHQMNAIWRGVVEKFVLYDHVVGAGKTFTAVARAMERRRMGLSRKPMIVVPNHLVESWAAEVYRLYPGAKMLAAGSKDFAKNRRRQLFARIATGDWDLVIVPHSSFEFIDIAPETEERYLEGELALAKQAIKDAEEEAAEQGLDGGWRKPFNVKEAERLAEKIETRLAGLKKRTRDKLLTFEQLGVDDMTIDEAHEFKNLYYSTRLTKVRGMGDKQGSQKALDIYNKVRVLREGDGSVCFMTGTPISNSAVEMYTLMRFLAADELRDLGLEHFDGWRSQFVDVSTKFEPNEAGRLQAVDRLGRSWANMRSLMELYYSFTDAVTLDDIRRDYRERNNGEEFPVPRVKGGDRQSIVVKPTPAQIEALEQILSGFDSLEAIEDPNERNAERLRLMDRARKVSLDVRAVNPMSDSDERGGKLDVVADEVAKLYQQWAEHKGTQLVFLDRSVPKAKGDDAKLKEFDKLRADQEQALRNGDEEAYRRLTDRLDGYDRNEMEELRIAQASPWTAYKQLKENMVARGIPADQIRFVQEANDDAQKKALFDAVNDGEVRVLIGSTPRMGAGTNVQKRLVGLHHVDVTWKPSDIEQREGRIIRQGNLFATKPTEHNPNPLYRPDFEVTINAYATERTVDAKMWDLNATKLRMINGIRNYDGSFTMDFPDEQSVGMAELAALASGDPMLLERVQLMAEIEQLELLERAHRRKMFGAQDRLDWARRSIDRLPARIAETRERAAFLADQFDKAEKEHAERRVTIEGKTFTQAERMEANKHALDMIDAAKAGNDKARFALNIDGQRYTSKDSVADAIGAALGDSAPFSMAMASGDVLHRRMDAARELAAKINAAMNSNPAGNFDAGRLLGLRLEVDYRRGQNRTTATLSLTTDEGRTVASEEKETEAKDVSSTLILNGLSDLVRATERQASGNSAEWDEHELERAKRSLPEYEEAVKEPFRQADDLKAKRARLEEVTKSLSGTGANSSATAPDDAMASLGVRSTGHTPSDIREALVARFGAKAIDSLERAGLLNIARYADVPVAERRPDGSASYSPRHGRAWLYADRLTPATAAAKLLHELGEHHGLEAMLGQRGWSAIKQQLRVMARVAGSDAQAAWSGVKALYAEFDGMTDSELASSDRFVHEVLARLGERDGGRKAPLWRGMIAKIKAWLASRWGISTFSERDMPALIEGSLMRLARGGNGGPRGGLNADAMAATRLGGETPRRDDFVTPDLPGWESNASGDLAYWEGKPIRMKWGFHDATRRAGAGVIHMAANGRARPERAAPDLVKGDEAENIARHVVRMLGRVNQQFEQFGRAGRKVGLSATNLQAGIIIEDMGDYWGVVSIAPPKLKADWGRGERADTPVIWSPGVAALGERAAASASTSLPKTVATGAEESADASQLQAQGQRITVKQIDDALNRDGESRKPVTVEVRGRRRTIDPNSPMGAVMERADAADPDMPMASVEFSMDAFREGVQPTSWLKSIIGRFSQSSELFGGLDKSIHSQLHKAAKNPYFGRVFDLLNRQMNDANRASLRPADRARTVLPKIDVMENWKEPLMAMLKGREHTADIDAAFKAVLEGTRRDEVFDNAQQAGITEAQFSVYQEFRGAIDASLDEMAAAEAFKLASSVLGDAIQRRIIDDPENAASFIKEGLTEARAAAQLRADAKKEAARFLVPRLNLNELATIDFDEYSMEQAQALRVLRDAMDEVKQIEGFIGSVDEVFDLADQLKREGYAPLMRFGRHYLDVYRTDPTTGEIIKDDDVIDPITGALLHQGTGEPIREFYSHFETEAERDEAEKALRAEFANDPDVVFNKGTVSEKAWEQLRGVSPESVMLFAKASGIEADSVMQDFYRKALSARSTLKRKIHRKNGADGLRGVRGYSENGARVLAAFLTSNGRRIGQLYHDKAIGDAIEQFPREQGSEKDEAIALRNHVQSPSQPGALSSGVLFAWYLGGSLSNFLINATQPAMVTLPWLSQHVGAMRAGSLLKRAYGLVRHPERMPRDLSSALSEAEEEGVVGANEAFHLYQEAGRPLANKFADSVVGRGVLKVFGQKGLEDAQYRLEGFLKMWGAPFAVAEHLNRRSTFIAAYLAAQEKGLDPYATAVRAVNETQFMYGKINAPNWARSSIGKLVFTFKLFSISYIEMLTRLARQGTAGRKAAILGLGMLFLATGMSGMPGADDLDDLIDTLLQSLGYNWSTKLEKKRLVESIVGKEFSGLVLNGLSSVGPFDLTNRMGLGNLIPASGLFKPAETNKMAQLFELVGPTGGLVKSWVDAADAVRGGDMSGVVRAAAPKALKDVYAGADMLETGEYRDGKGRKVTDVTTGDALSKMIGFQPADVADVQRKIGSVIPLTTLQRQASSSVAEKWAQMIENGEPGAAVRARQMVDDWNRKNPDTPIAVPKLANVMHRVKQSRLSKQARMVKNAPSGMRDTVEEIVGEDEE